MRLLTVLALLLVIACAPSGPEKLNLPSPAFSLRDADGATVTLDSLRGKPTIVTFLYTNCPDVCPLIAEKLRLASNDLGDRANIVVVSVDPVGDTPEAVRAYSDSKKMRGKWRYLIGDFGELQPVWKGFAISPGLVDPGPGHTDAIWILDRDGVRQFLYRGEADPKDLVSAVRRLT